MKKLMHLICLLPVAGLLLTTGCSKKAETAEVHGNPNPEHVIALITKLTNTVYWQAVFAGAKEAGKDYGYEITWGGSDRETNSTPQIELVDKAISEHVSGVVIAPVDRTALVPSVNHLADLKIACVSIDSGLDAVRFLSIASTDNYQGGVLAAQSLGKALGGKGNILVVRHIPGSHAAAKRVAGFTDTIAKEFPSITIVDSESGQDEAAISERVTEEMLRKHPDVQGLFACNVDTSVEIGIADV